MNHVETVDTIENCIRVEIDNDHKPSGIFTTTADAYVFHIVREGKSTLSFRVPTSSLFDKIINNNYPLAQHGARTHA